MLLFISVVFFLRPKEVKLNNTSFQVEIADTSEERYKGLSNRNYLCGNCAMLFVFNDSIERSFVMREMMMPIDIIFINNNVVTDIYKNLEPEDKDYSNYYNSSQAVDMVLEINANYSEKYNINTGDRINIE